MKSGIKMSVKTRCCQCGDKVNIHWASDKELADFIRKKVKDGKYVCVTCRDEGPGTVVKIQHLTVNQAMVLLDVYRGTFDVSRHLNTYAKDLGKLVNLGYIRVVDGFFIMRVKGDARVKEMLK